MEALKIFSLLLVPLLCALISFSLEIQGTQGKDINDIRASDATLYDIYTEGGIINPTGPALVAEGPSFTLNGKDFYILSGAIHYFRVVPEYWRDRLKKLKASGCNTLETYVPWNLHEQIQGNFSFEDNLDLRTFLQIAKEEDLFVILRPGPYICSEWEFGGLPSWLLRYKDIKLRTSDPIYEDAVQKYYQQLIPLVKDLQFTSGGPIIMVQIENEYGSYNTDDQPYLNFLKQLMEDLGIVELFVTSDSCGTDECRQHGSLPGVLMTSNFQNNPIGELDRLHRLQPDRPLMVMEFWTGWFDIWGENHNTLDVERYEELLTEILSQNASLSFYMFHGGTSFGYMNGANTDSTFLDVYLPIVTSYDYDALISEAGDYQPKFNKTREILQNFNKGHLWDVTLPPLPLETPKSAYGEYPVLNTLSLNDLLSLLTPQFSDTILPMELLDVYGNVGQQFGFIVYQTLIDIPSEGAVLTIMGRARDSAQIIFDGQVIATTEWKNEDFSYTFTSEQAGTQKLLQILVENSGRINFGLPHDFTVDKQAKGLLDPVLINGVSLETWSIYPLDFNSTFVEKLSSGPWSPYLPSQVTFATVFQTTLIISDTPTDTFINMMNWTKGIVIINNFILGRYWNIGPQHTLYIPAPLLHTGDNQVYIFELENGSGTVIFQDTPVLG